MLESKFRIGPHLAWKRPAITSDYRTNLTAGDATIDPILDGLFQPTTGQYLGRTIGGCTFKKNFQRVDESRHGLNALLDVSLLKQSIDITMTLQSNADFDLSSLVELPEMKSNYNAFGGGNATPATFSLLIAATNLRNPDPAYWDIVQFILFFRVWAEPTDTKIGPGHTSFNVIFHTLTGLDSTNCPYPNGRNQYHRWFSRLGDINTMIDPNNPNVPLGSNPDILYPIYPLPFFNL